MLIVCPSCTTSYEVEAALLGEHGRSVRCVRCRTVWLATLPLETAASSGDAWPVPRAPDPWAELENEASPSELLASPGGDAPTSAEASGPQWDDPQWEEPSADRPPAMDAASDTSEPITVADAPSVAPSAESPTNVGDGRLPTPSDAPDPHEDIETVAARRAQLEAQRARFRLSSVTAVIVVLVALNAALIGWRADVVRVAPQTASLFAAIGFPVNLRSLLFEGLSATKDTQDGVTVLFVEGNIMNPTSRQVDVPRLRLALRDQEGHEVFSWTVLPSRSALGPHEALPFHSRLAAPPVEGRYVVARFFNRHDKISAAR